MAKITITNASHEDCVLAAGVVGKSKVVHCPNPADAASPVALRAGDFSRPVGQSADYRHDLSDLPRVHGAALVETYWDNERQQWYTTIETDADEEAIRDFIGKRNAERHRAELAANREASRAAEAEKTAAIQSAVATAIEIVRAVAEQWAPGRVSVKRANDGEVIVGRWDAPNMPGYGKPVEVRRAVRGGEGQVELASADASYAFAWH